MPFGTRLQCSLGSEASDPRQLEILNAAVKFMEANWLKLRNSLFTVKGLLILGLKKHSYGYLWLLLMANITVNLNSELF